MGEAKRKQSATLKLIAAHPTCCLCGGNRPTVTREHMPPKAMFDASHRPDDLVLPACKECNEGTRTADLVVSIVSRWRFAEGSLTERQDHKRLSAHLRTQSPDIMLEWEKAISDQRRAHDHLSQFIPIPRRVGFVSIGPKTLAQLNLFAHKLVLGLYFHKIGRSLPTQGLIWAFWKTKEDVAYAGPPDFLLKMLPDYGSLVQGRWDTSQTFEYRTGRDQAEGTFGCCARLRGGLLAGGFSVDDAKAFHDEDSSGWTSPSDLLAASLTERFAKRDL